MISSIEEIVSNLLELFMNPYFFGIVIAIIMIKLCFGSKGPLKPSLGEYRCSCGRYWFSHLSWDDCYQVCKQCYGRVYPSTPGIYDVLISKLWAVFASYKAKEKGPKHPKEMCHMCQQLGQYCGNYRQGFKTT